MNNTNTQNTKVAWLSRHAMTPDQKSDLAKTLDVDIEHLDIEEINHVWQATGDCAADKKENVVTWRRLTRDFQVICGVFPQVALEAMGCAGLDNVYTAISQARPDLRVGEGPIPFVHLRWSRVLPAAYLRAVMSSVEHTARQFQPFRY